jgi:FkbH-like protein
MKLKVHSVVHRLQDVQELIENGQPSEYVPVVRNWLLSGPRFSEFEGFSRFLAKAEIATKLGAEIPSERWAVIGGYTPRPVASALRMALLAHGICAIVHEADYAAFDIELLSDQSATLAFRPEHILICTGHHHIADVPPPGASSEATALSSQAAVRYLQTRWQRMQEKTGAILHQHTFCLPALSSVGRLDDKYPWGQRRFFRNLNEILWQRDGHEIRVIDVDALQQRIGSDDWWSSRWYHMGKLPFNPERLRDYGVLLHAHLAAVRGTSRKCLVVDLDDTLWGGVIGDDGLEGIVLGNGSAAGEEFLETCNYIKNLGRAGVILGVVSKNDAKIAELPFREHKEIPLTLSDFAAFKASWQPKSRSLQELVGELNIGMDAVVYLDDNPAECEEVARACPAALVLQVVQGPDGIARSLESLHLFDRQSFTAEDASRSASYASMQMFRQRSELENDLPSFLSSLDMQCNFQAIEPSQVSRAAQLFAKTNQFNLTQIKFTESELTQMAEDDTVTCFVATLDDKFAKHGLVSALVVRRQQNAVAEIVNWVMSCRVFNRTLEEYVLLRLCEGLAAEGYRSIMARLVETEKNRHVHGLFGRLEFESNGSSGRETCFRYEFSDRWPWKAFIRGKEASIELV